MRPPRILLVEDEYATGEAITFLLELHGFQVTAVSNGREALESLGGDLPDLILSDVMMPEMDGLEMVRRIRERPDCREIPVVVMSAAHHLLASDLPVQVLLFKPLEFSQLLEVVRELTREAGRGETEQRS